MEDEEEGERISSRQREPCYQSLKVVNVSVQGRDDGAWKRVGSVGTEKSDRFRNSGSS